MSALFTLLPLPSPGNRKTLLESLQIKLCVPYHIRYANR